MEHCKGLHFSSVPSDAEKELNNCAHSRRKATITYTKTAVVCQEESTSCCNSDTADGGKESKSGGGRFRGVA